MVKKVRVYEVDTEHWDVIVVKNKFIVKMLPLQDIEKLLADTGIELDYK